jgi:Ca-activated chloride channel family protein
MIPPFDTLHWLRPDWLWAMAVLPLLAGWWWQRRRRANVWHEAVDPHLLAHLLDRGDKVRGRLALAIGMLGYVLAVLALAGPSWRQSEQPSWQGQAPLVIALDLSSASLAGDLPPSRLAQARAKLATLLRERKDGQVGLVAYAGAAFTVAPLTGDAANVALFLEALHPNVMPVDGQRSDRAIAWSARLLAQAGLQRGRILLLTDHADAATRKAAADAWARGYSVSVIGLGTADGAPYRAADGTILHARLDADSLRQLAATAGGDYVALTRDDSDLARLGVLDPDDQGIAAGGDAELAGQAGGKSGMSWQDDGYWLLLPLMALALLAFRRGAPVVVLVLCLWLPGRSAHAADLWQRPDQRAHRTMEQAAQAYRQGDFAMAAKLYGELDSAEADYNRGNALARESHYPEAIEAYEQALRRNPAMPDALANKQAVEAAMKRQPPPGQKGQPNQSNNERNAGNQGADDQGRQAGQQGRQPQASQDGPGSPQDESGQGKPDESTPRQDGETSQDGGNPPPESPTPADASSQQAADQAQRERMQAALAQAEKDAGKDDGAAPEATPESAEQRERRIANEAWLRRVPDDPGGLLREKFRIEYQRRLQHGGAEE